MALDPKVDEKLRALVAKHEDLGHQLADPAIVSDLPTYRNVSKQYAELGQLASQAARAFAEEVREAKFPGPEHSYR